MSGPRALGAYRLDVGQRLLLRGSDVVHLGPKAFELLRILVDHSPNVVAKPDLLAQLWPGTFVTEGNLATLIRVLRVAFQDDPHNPHFIRTVHGVGYAFAGAIERPADDTRATPLPEWKLVWAGTELPLLSGENIVGRPAQGVVGLDAPTVSRRHARVVINGTDATLEDLGSKNGTWLGNTRLVAPAKMKDGDRVRLGSVLVTVRCNSTQVSTKTAVRERDVTEPRHPSRRRTST